MGLAGKVLPLAGQCLEVPLAQDASVLNFVPFREFCIHVTVANPTGGGSMDMTGIGGTYGCAKRSPTSADGTAELPVFSMPSGSVPRGAIYGHTGEEVKVPGKVKATDLAHWDNREVYAQRRWFASGPAVTVSHSATEVRRRMKGTPNSSYAGRDKWTNTNAQVPLKQGNDWLAPVHPAGCIWTNKGINEPMLAGETFELCGQKPEVHLPFCHPMPVWSDDARTQLAGKYMGLSFLHFASAAVIRKPVKVCSIFPCSSTPSCGAATSADKDMCLGNGYLPEDYYAEINPGTGTRPPVKSHWQFLTVDTVVFMVGDTIDSPRVGSYRHWFAHKPHQENNDPGNEYFYTYYPGFTEWWRFPMVFETETGPHSIPVNISGLAVYMTP